MTDSRKAVSELAKMICEAAKRVVEDASFDKTFFGVVTSTSNGKYIVTSAGQEYSIKSSLFFTVGERVAITAVQNNYNTLILRKL